MTDTKKFILNADDFGLNKYTNRAVLEGCINGFLTGASICANTDAFDSAINDILPDCSNLSIGVHLNIVEGKSLTKCNIITNSKGEFNKGYLYFLLNRNNQKLLDEIEVEFRAQIEKVKSVTEIDHIDSHVHIHSIPQIFELVCRLAKEYNIEYVRTQYEKPFLVPSFIKNFNHKFPINLVKLLLLNYFTKINRKTVKKYGLSTNDYIVGVTYTSMMDSDVIKSALSVIDENVTIECLIHPYKSDLVQKEFDILTDNDLKEFIIKNGFEIVGFKNT